MVRPRWHQQHRIVKEVLFWGNMKSLRSAACDPSHAKVLLRVLDEAEDIASHVCSPQHDSPCGLEPDVMVQ